MYHVLCFSASMNCTSQASQFPFGLHPFGLNTKLYLNLCPYETSLSDAGAFFLGPYPCHGTNGHDFEVQ